MGRRIDWIHDNLSANWVPPIRAYSAAHKIERVPTAPHASYLNPVECHFSALNQFVACWDAFGYAFAHHVRYRNSGRCDQRIAADEARCRIVA